MKFVVTRIERIALWSSFSVGTPHAFILACFFIALWVMTGPFAGWSDSWTLSGNTIMTVISFLMMFLLQHTANQTVEEMHGRLRTIEAQNEIMLKIMRGDIIVAPSGYLVDYTRLSDEELAAVDEHAKEHLAGSTVVWQSEGI